MNSACRQGHSRRKTPRWYRNAYKLGWVSGHACLSCEGSKGAFQEELQFPIECSRAQLQRLILVLHLSRNHSPDIAVPLKASAVNL